ncbi:glycine dehydrogenase [Tamlana nanhaiensis]|uniref:Glycine dehydrogenase n=1 Tax=Neotamlana nanhaiensis TaxID=1382798 RepID=A0A0D7VXK6_9FLAO|nr:hypothetical protein [Tamlana nanhaiensis]KJD31524.1 glycine dehydrogenase [Tamlana nanhaiensis]
MKKNVLFISCEEAQHICDKNQYGEANWIEKLKLNIRLIYCRVTQSYVKQNKKLSKVIKNSEVKCMDNQCKETIRKNFDKALKEHNS